MTTGPDVFLWAVWVGTWPTWMWEWPRVIGA